MNRKKKIGVLTFHRAENYGSIMQAYALQTYLKEKRKIDNELIDYVPETQGDFYKLFVPITSIRNLLGNILKLSIAKKYYLREKAFERFLNTRLKVSEKSFTCEEDLKNIQDDYWCIITGSDQIWNTECADFSWVYLLKGVTGVKKISYAASMGGGKISDRDIYKNCLSDYDYISVREDYAVKTIGEMFSQKNLATVCVDPTLLLDRKDYEKITSSRRIEGDYIFFYSVYHDDQLLHTIRLLRKKWNLPIVTLISRNNSYKVLFNGIQLPMYEAPEDFLSYIKYAKFVITNSFHGSVFSIIFEKEFYYLGDYQKDPRLYQLFTMTGTEDAAISYEQLEKKAALFGTRSGRNLSKEISELRKKSEEYLMKALVMEQE